MASDVEDIVAAQHEDNSSQSDGVCGEKVVAYDEGDEEGHNEEQLVVHFNECFLIFVVVFVIVLLDCFAGLCRIFLFFLSFDTVVFDAFVFHDFGTDFFIFEVFCLSYVVLVLLLVEAID